MELLDEEIGRRVHMVLWDRGLTNARLATVLGLARPTVSQRLRGQRPWTVSELYTVATHYGVPLSEILPSVEEWAELCAARDSDPQPADKGHTVVTSLDAYRRVRRAPQLAVAV